MSQATRAADQRLLQALEARDADSRHRFSVVLVAALLSQMSQHAKLELIRRGPQEFFSHVSKVCANQQLQPSDVSNAFRMFEHCVTKNIGPLQLVKANGFSGESAHG